MSPRVRKYKNTGLEAQGSEKVQEIQIVKEEVQEVQEIQIVKEVQEVQEGTGVDARTLMVPRAA